MLYCVSYSNGVVGIFSSKENIQKLVFDKYPSIMFITQIYKNSDNPTLVDEKHVAWLVIYKNSESIAYVSDNKLEAVSAINVLDKIGKAYENNVEYTEQEIDTVCECTTSILDSLQHVYGESGVLINSSKNIISYV